MAEHFAEKRHDPTPRRRQQARQEGRVARSQDLVSAALLIVALLVLVDQATHVAAWCGNLMTGQLNGEHWMSQGLATSVDSAAATTLFRQLISQIGQQLLPFLALVLITAVALNIGQIGFLLVPRRLALDPARISPWQGWQRWVSADNGFRFVMGLLKLIVVMGIGAMSLWSQRDGILEMARLTELQMGAAFGRAILRTGVQISIGLLVLAVIDYAYQRWKHEQELRMTDQELREELKSVQGDPQVLMRRQQVQRQIAGSRLYQQVDQGRRIPAPLERETARAIVEGQAQITGNSRKGTN